ncbi:hypothetical protein Hanom_Chr01g00017871 [Helianthus anomalus]
MLLNRLPSPFIVILNVEFHEFFSCETLYKSNTSRLKRLAISSTRRIAPQISGVFHF